MQFDTEREWVSSVGGTTHVASFIDMRWGPEHVWVLDLETGEGARR